MVDRRWGGSLFINPDSEQPGKLLLYDLWNDPMCLEPVNDEHRDLVEKYTAFLEAQLASHQALVQQFAPGGEVALTPEQLRALRALGYIQ